jgi:hypothetical protein
MVDTTPEVSRGEPLTANEAIAALDFHANKAAKAGNYGLHDDLHAAANTLDELQSQYEALKADVEDMRDELRALRPRAMETIFSSRYEPPEYKAVPQFRDEDHE